ncbi:MAG: STAS-like domain-containing protein [Verrucomicrobia bacterium]|nr:STAS-like domain-containing protein [Verrucomicrobiota bacterium]
MNNRFVIRVFEMVGSSLCVASDDGQKVHDEVASALKAEKKVAISFANVEGLTSAFLNAAIGQLYGEFSEDEIRRSLSVGDMNPDDIALLKRVVETAKQYFKNPKRFEKSVQEALGGR